MRVVVSHLLRDGRVREPEPWGSDDSYGLAGAFEVMGPSSHLLYIISSGPRNVSGWEHVSVSLYNRTPNWAEMCFVKNLFWGDEECVVQFHPPKSEYVNCHPYTLHLWKADSVAFPTPPSILVGPKVMA